MFYSTIFYLTLLLQVPYETLNKRFRAAQKNIDRETSHVTMVVAELEKTLSSFPVVDSVVSLLDGVVEKLSALKRKVRSAALLYTRTQPQHLLTFLYLVRFCVQQYNNYTNSCNGQPGLLFWFR